MYVSCLVLHVVCNMTHLWFVQELLPLPLLGRGDAELRPLPLEDASCPLSSDRPEQAAFTHGHTSSAVTKQVCTSQSITKFPQQQNNFKAFCFCFMDIWVIKRRFSFFCFWWPLLKIDQQELDRTGWNRVEIHLSEKRNRNVSSRNQDLLSSDNCWLKAGSLWLVATMVVMRLGMCHRLPLDSVRGQSAVEKLPSVLLPL